MKKVIDNNADSDTKYGGSDDCDYQDKTDFEDDDGVKDKFFAIQFR